MRSIIPVLADWKKGPFTLIGETERCSVSWSWEHSRKGDLLLKSSKKMR